MMSKLFFSSIDFFPDKVRSNGLNSFAGRGFLEFNKQKKILRINLIMLRRLLLGF